MRAYIRAFGLRWQLSPKRSAFQQVRSHSLRNKNKNSCSHQRVWEAGKAGHGTYWTERLVDSAEEDSILHDIDSQERQGARMKNRQYGVLSEDPVIDMRLLTQNYTVSSLATALRDREDALQHAAVLAEESKHKELAEFLKIFHPRHVLKKRESKVPDLTKSLDSHALDWLRKTLMRMPRSVVSAHEKRAAVVLPLCTVQGVPCILLEKRAPHLRAHPDEVCLPGGMYCEVEDRSILQTCLREMREEIGGLSGSDEATKSTATNNDTIQVLGVFRINWGEVHHMVGIAVTPVVCFLGELPEQLFPNPDEVSQVFTVSLESVADPELWITHEGQGLAPQFVGGPHPIWGLTGYIMDRFRKDILLRHHRSYKP
mmetsp:Transcript_28283/g.65789  ORF Transcript_28283/g.65789 Transcript_28283/m.65789 type:complete len:371 (-) Transcript_28283:36-1148(-)